MGFFSDYWNQFNRYAWLVKAFCYLMFPTFNNLQKLISILAFSGSRIDTTMRVAMKSENGQENRVKKEIYFYKLLKSSRIIKKCPIKVQNFTKSLQFVHLETGNVDMARNRLPVYLDEGTYHNHPIFLLAALGPDLQKYQDAHGIKFFPWNVICKIATDVVSQKSFTFTF